MLLASACATAPSPLPRGAQAYAIVPQAETTPGGDYVVQPLDTLNITVFREPDLTLKDVQVDASGDLSFPLLGSVPASRRTLAQLAAEMARELGARYLRDPQVSVALASGSAPRVAVEGDVAEPGVYEIGGSATLLEALARAKSPTRTAALDEVIVFRTVDGRRSGAVFDVAAIRRGTAPDPRIRGGDTIVVGYSAVKGAFRDFLTAAPLIAAFRFY